LYGAGEIAMKKYLILIILFIFTFLLQQCGDNPVNTQEGRLIYSRDSVSVIYYDTLPLYEIPVVPPPDYTGISSSNLRLEFDGETNLDSITGIPHLKAGLASNNKFSAGVNTYSPSEINKHFIIDFNIIEPAFWKMYSFNLYLKVSLRGPFAPGYKYVRMKNIRLTTNSEIAK
jgi:hypothetical protein